MELAAPAPPEPAEVEYHWTEVTEDFLTACKGTWTVILYRILKVFLKYFSFIVISYASFT